MAARWNGAVKFGPLMRELYMFDHQSIDCWTPNVPPKIVRAVLVTVGIFASMVATVSANPVASEDPTREITTFLASLRDMGVPGAMLIVSDGQPVTQNIAVGYADRRRGGVPTTEAK